MSKDKTWSGRFNEPVSELVKKYTGSIDFDKRLAEWDIQGSLAHAQMLTQSGVLSEDDLSAIRQGMAEIIAEIKEGTISWSLDLEDVHMNIERRLTNKIGDAGKTPAYRPQPQRPSRHRHPPMAARPDYRYSKPDSKPSDGLGRFGGTKTPKPSCPVSPICKSPSLSASDTICSPTSKCSDAISSAWPTAANASTVCRSAPPHWPVPPTRFSAKSPPSYWDLSKSAKTRSMPCLTAIFAIEFTAAASLIMVHLSRLSEELILWMSPRFGFIDIADRFCTGSSIMPQKKNPDVPELVRGKSGRVIGHLIGLVTLMKSQPLAYNKDNQEDKEPLFDTADTLIDTLRIYADMMRGVTVKPDNMRAAVMQGFATATDLADYLVKKGMPFRDSHEVVAQAVRHADEAGVDLSELPLEVLQGLAV